MRAASSLVVAALIGCAAGQVQAQLRTVDTVAPLLIEAIRLDDAEGILAGDAARFMAETFGAYAPIIVKVKRLHDIEPAGCARLKVTTTQAQVSEPAQEVEEGQPQAMPPTDQKLEYEIDFCENGRLPAEGGGAL